MWSDPDEAVARGLTWALLAAPAWTRTAVIGAAAESLGRRHRWLARVVEPALARYRTAPLDRPDELTGFLLAQTPLRELLSRARRQRRPVRVRVVATAPAAMGRRRWPVPEVADLPALARLLELPAEQLDWVADCRGRQRRTPPGPLHLFRHSWRVRPGGTPRLLESPTPLLRAVLRRVHDRILVWVPVHPAAHGFVRGRSAITNAARHVGADTVVCLDLQTFFTTITAARVNGLFAAMGYPQAVAWALTALCTHQTPIHVLTAMPDGGDSSARHRLRSRLRARHLPQGAPTSPALANLIAYGLDRRLSGYAAAAGLSYTRYADDLTFSGGPVAVPRLVAAATAIAREEGFVINRDKTRTQHAGERHQVTGVVTNRGLSVPRDYHDQLRAVLHDAVVNGPDAANRIGHPAFRDHLAGRVGWVESVNPVRGRRLRSQLDAIVWPRSDDQGRIS